MPIYEYRCAACGKRSSSLLPSYSSPDPACQHCGKAELKRLVSSFATVRSDGDDFGGEDDFGGGDGDEGMGGDEAGSYGGFDGGDDDF